MSFSSSHRSLAIAQSLVWHGSIPLSNGSFKYLEIFRDLSGLGLILSDDRGNFPSNISFDARSSDCGEMTPERSSRVQILAEVDGVTLSCMTAEKKLYASLSLHSASTLASAHASKPDSRRTQEYTSSVLVHSD